MKKWQIGVSNITWPYEVRWLTDYVLAADQATAERLATEQGYYRNLRVREA